jgi:hypothetical protein
VNIPEGLSGRGSELWTSLLEQHPAMSEADKQVALEACRTADLIDRLERICLLSEPVIENDRGTLVTHPAIVEVRQQRQTLKQLVAALRLPDSKTGKQPQHRGARGVYKPGGTVTSLDKFRAG